MLFVWLEMLQFVTKKKVQYLNKCLLHKIKKADNCLSNLIIYKISQTFDFRFEIIFLINQIILHPIHYTNFQKDRFSNTLLNPFCQ